MIWIRMSKKITNYTSDTEITAAVIVVVRLFTFSLALSLIVALTLIAHKLQSASSKAICFSKWHSSAYILPTKHKSNVFIVQSLYPTIGVCPYCTFIILERRVRHTIESCKKYVLWHHSKKKNKVDHKMQNSTQSGLGNCV